MHIPLFLILLSSITIFVAHASEEQQSITALLARQRATKRTPIIIADESTISLVIDLEKSEEIKTCAKDECDTCSQKIIDPKLGW